MDARQRRSQERLYAAVLRLAAERPVADLSVTAVANEAGVHRSTFYEHAASPADLLEAALLAELDELREGLLADDTAEVPDAVRGVTADVLRHVERHAAIYRRGLGTGSTGGSLHAMLSNHFRETSRQLLDAARVEVRVEAPGVPDDVVADLATRFIADGTVGVIEGWLAGDLDVDDLLTAYAALLPPWWPSHADHPSTRR
ncbi:MAG TPA: TetR/AcrR family transcriptional regulator [Nocardioides sp.]|uniref:TetR/AcrR family transcriptional regulator n=1 Tax=Nocardioides sp. TaxID=35761 RepID=UPI002CEDFD1F|nr:TetR/AcrR family transcriptional regulator [Nocardioides sp.]HTW15030.1 TetR/AcrR family transcriptional regulator [Nocardioides sp.]